MKRDAIGYLAMAIQGLPGVLSAGCSTLLCLSVSVGQASAGAGNRGGVTSPGTANSVNYLQTAIHGAELRLWINNRMSLGRQAFDDPFENGAVSWPGLGLGMQYGRDENIEHLFGAGPWIGGLVNGITYVLQGYSSDGQKHFAPDQENPRRAMIMRTAARDSFLYPNRRGCDDDGDGLVDEDPRDGMDNDGDWDPLWNDVGSDGVPDINEVGCWGGYDAATNPDPAFDNYEPENPDLCHPDSAGNHPMKSDPYRYTEHNGIPDSGEPNVDEDYAAISDDDQSASAENIYPPSASDRAGIKIIQRCMSWYNSWAGGIIPIEYTFVNIGDSSIADVYLGFFADMDVGPVDRGDYYYRNYCCYIESLRTVYVHNPLDRGSTPAGVTLLDATGGLDSQQVYVSTWDFSGWDSRNPPESWYRLMSGAEPYFLTHRCQSIHDLGDTRFLISVGPFRDMKPGDTLTLTIAFVAGETVYGGGSSLVAQAARAIVLSKRGYVQPTPPPSPALSLSQGDRRIELNWGSANMKRHPMKMWDLYSQTAGSYPPDHWRREDPSCDEVENALPCEVHSPCLPAQTVPGGRIFEGYRLYRSEDRWDYPGSQTFSLIREYDLDDEFGYNFGIDTAYIDSNLFPGKRYWYAVTSFGIPEIVTLTIKTADGAIVEDRISVDGLESTFYENVARLDLKYSAGEQVGDVKVVPNPYRADQDYTLEGGGWEGYGRNWNEYRRVLKFIHLPRSCTIRIYALTGDFVKTIKYVAPATNPNQGELDWDMISDGGYFIASGVYIYSVESDLGTQFSKFVVIR